MFFSKLHRHRLLGVLSVILFLIGFCMLAVTYFSFHSTTEKLKDPAGNSDKRVLLLFSYSSTYISEEYVRDGVQDVLYQEGIDYDCLYMDTKEFGDEESQALFTQSLENRLRKIKDDYDGIITCDDDALSYVQAHQSDYFTGLPVTFLGVNDVDHAAEANANENMSGFVEYNYLGKLIEVAQKLLPKVTRVVGIVDNTETGQGSEKQFLSYQEDFPDLKFEVLNASLTSRANLGNVISQYGDETILIYLDVIEDNEYNYYTIAENSIYFSECANIPVFRTGMGGVGEGIVGTVFPDFEETASLAAKELISMMNGNPKDANLDSSDKYTLLFDVDKMDEFDLHKSLLPLETEYVNDQIDFMDQYGGVIWPVGICLLALLLASISTSSLRRENDRRGVELNEKENQIIYASEHDSLTGLYNQHYTMNKLHEFLKPNCDYSMLVVDVDELGFINDNYSRSIGDSVVCEVAERLYAFTKQNNGFISHYGGDEFLLVFNDKTLDEKDPWLKEILTIVQKPIEVEGQMLVVSVSIGVKNIASTSVAVPEEHVLDADVAMYEAKRLGKCQVAIYSKQMRDRAAREREILKEVKDALENDKFYMMYQPQVYTQSGKVYGLEALIRLESERFSPGEFIPVAEKNGLICKLGRVVVQKVVCQMHDWTQMGMKLKPVSINYSAGQMMDIEFVSYLESVLEKYDIPSELIEIEITEDLFMDNTRESVKLLEDLNQIGVKLLMDDFGTGYSSLSYLSYIPFNVIKIDKTLIDSWANEKSKKTMDDLIQMAHHLDRSLIAEGVETEEQFRILRELHCDMIQGYYFSKPLKEDLVRKLASNPKVW